MFYLKQSYIMIGSRADRARALNRRLGHTTAKILCLCGAYIAAVARQQSPLHFNLTTYLHSLSPKAIERSRVYRSITYYFFFPK